MRSTTPKRNAILPLTPEAHQATLDQLEQSLGEAKALMEAIDQHSLVSIADPAGVITYVNDKFISVSGYSSEELVGSTHRIVKSDAQPDSFWIAMWATISSGYVWRDVVCNRAKDGRFYWVNTLIAPFYADGRIEKYISIRTDITAVKLAEQALATERLRLSNIIIGTRAGTWEWNVQTGEFVVNERFAEMIGYTLQELMPIGPDAWLSYCHADDVRTSAIAQAKYLAGDAEYFESVLRMRHRDGHWVWLQARGKTSSWTSDVRPEWMSGTLLDISEQKQAESESARTTVMLQTAMKAAEAATVAKGQFLATMSHEIRTPMNAILGMLKLLQNTDLTANQLDYVSKAEGATNSLLGLLNDTLDFSKIDAGKMTLDSHPFVLEALLRDLSVIVSANLVSKRVQVLFDIDPTMPETLIGDAMRIKQILINLGGNAVKFTQQGEVTLQIRVRNRHRDTVDVEFLVHDTGIGIATENQAHIFEAFSQAESSTTRRFGGSGLGLAISKRLVGLMGSDLLLKSELGVGSTFSFAVTLPFKEEAEDASQACIDGHKYEVPNLSVLVVDANAKARALLVAMVKSLGWQAEAAGSGAEAVAMVDARIQTSQPCYDVIFVDWQLYDMDGWGALQRIKNLGLTSPKAPIVVMVTARGRELLTQRTTQEQASLNAFLVKPVTAAMLFDAVVDAREGRSNLRAKPRSKDESPSKLSRMRLLVVEDNFVNQQVAQELLTNEGAVVVIAANGQLGVDAVAQAQVPFDAVLMDLQMPVMDGYGATQAIRHRLGMKALPIIAMTANALASDREACLAAGMNDHVGKPINLDHLVSVLLAHTGWDAIGGSAGRRKEHNAL